MRRRCRSGSSAVLCQYLAAISGQSIISRSASGESQKSLTEDAALPSAAIHVVPAVTSRSTDVIR